MQYKFLVVGDIHFGYYPPELLYKEFQLILSTIDEYRPDCVVIAGDYYDTKLSMASAHSVYSVRAFSDLIKKIDKNAKKCEKIIDDFYIPFKIKPPYGIKNLVFAECIDIINTKSIDINWIFGYNI